MFGRFFISHFSIVILIFHNNTSITFFVWIESVATAVLTWFCVSSSHLRSWTHFARTSLVLAACCVGICESWSKTVRRSLLDFDRPEFARLVVDNISLPTSNHANRVKVIWIFFISFIFSLAVSRSSWNVNEKKRMVNCHYLEKASKNHWFRFQIHCE